MARRITNTWEGCTNVVLNGSVLPPDFATWWRSEYLDPHGFSSLIAYVQIQILSDSNPLLTNPLALRANLVHSGGMGTGPFTGIAANLPGFQKGYVGTGDYTLDILEATPGPDLLRNPQVLSQGVAVELAALGQPQGRVLRIQHTVTLVCGESF